jgi:hypothetical protein
VPTADHADIGGLVAASLSSVCERVQGPAARVLGAQLVDRVLLRVDGTDIDDGIVRRRSDAGHREGVLVHIQSDVQGAIVFHTDLCMRQPPLGVVRSRLRGSGLGLTHDEGFAQVSG